MYFYWLKSSCSSVEEREGLQEATVNPRVISVGFMTLQRWKFSTLPFYPASLFLLFFFFYIKDEKNETTFQATFWRIFSFAFSIHDANKDLKKLSVFFKFLKFAATYYFVRLHLWKIRVIKKMYTLLYYHKSLS